MLYVGYHPRHAAGEETRRQVCLRVVVPAAQDQARRWGTVAPRHGRSTCWPTYIIVVTLEWIGGRNCRGVEARAAQVCHRQRSSTDSRSRLERAGKAGDTRVLICFVIVFSIYGPQTLLSACLVVVVVVVVVLVTTLRSCCVAVVRKKPPDAFLLRHCSFLDILPGLVKRQAKQQQKHKVGYQG